MNAKITAIAHMLDQAKVHLTHGQTTSAQIILEEVRPGSTAHTHSLDSAGLGLCASTFSCMTWGLSLNSRSKT